ncbi:hypothetical protein TI10_15980 [Photorhabdus luminescens subsp. luminescens]|uniref:Methylglutaconyl-CoA hydratase n=1 Tax=Photorhabdus luminescens TaxID=29488 RepID=A0A1G5RA50_PHOLU|nr:enoyl-CoA hydratase-related protein [Photorhabdus luminescens]KMW72089.1 hypothetical protein TI10_15980 [Photorhabdus luminescens subsp. luminescens]SCZ70650.1 methylglutaconyl-CoA hydratase [Photorhabdus luminescens]
MQRIRLEWMTNQIACLTLNKPERGNALNETLMKEFSDYLQQLASNPNLRALLIQSTGKHFCTGADIHWLKRSLNFSTEENILDARLLERLLQQLNEFPVPVLMIAKGAVFGGALGLLSCADYVLALKDTRFSFSEALLGLVPAIISPYVARAIGLRQARRYMLTAEVFDVQQAIELGLVHQQASESNLDELRDNWIKLIQKTAPHASRKIKSMLTRLSTQDGLHNEQQTNIQLMSETRTSSEGQMGLRAFLEKRPPPWS